jgi:hypothetical protein
MCSNIVDVSSYDELKVAISQGKWARGPWSARYFFLLVLYLLRTCISSMLKHTTETHKIANLMSCYN